MRTILIRGIPPDTHRQLQKLAEEVGVSFNQMIIRIIKEQVKLEQNKKEDEKRREKAFRRLDEIRKKIHRKYGPQEDSTFIIRKFRDGGEVEGLA